MCVLGEDVVATSDTRNHMKLVKIADAGVAVGGAPAGELGNVTPALPLSDGVDPWPHTADDESVCAICMDKMEQDGGATVAALAGLTASPQRDSRRLPRSLAQLTCGHTYHLSCIGAAFNQKGAMICPVCRDVGADAWRASSAAPVSTHEVHDTPRRLAISITACLHAWLRRWTESRRRPSQWRPCTECTERSCSSSLNARDTSF
jgi:hypothetical protein